MPATIRFGSGLLLLLLFCSGAPLWAQDAGELDELRKEIEDLRKRDRQNRKLIKRLERKLNQLEETETTPADDPDAALEAALEEAQETETVEPEPTADIASTRVGDARLRLIDISVDALFAFGGSTARNETIADLQAGGHDPRQRGATVQQLELSLTGAVDPYFDAEVHLIYFLDPEGESRFELEEAFATTRALPGGFQIELGHFYTEFGRHNPQHPHQWHWLDTPVINTRFFGADGMRGPGLSVRWLSPFPWFSEFHFGGQNARGETMVSFLASDEVFEERPVGGRPFTDRTIHSMEDFVYHARWVNAFDVTEDISLQLGVTGLLGPNPTGRDGKTAIYGADLFVKWKPGTGKRGWPFFIFQGEIMKRHYLADGYVDPTFSPPFDDSTMLHDWGAYVQFLIGFAEGWAAGIRYDFADGERDRDGIVSHADHLRDPFRSRRHRISPMISWEPTEFSRLRLQYNYDKADFTPRSENNHSVWFGVELFWGDHAAHTY